MAWVETQTDIDNIGIGRCKYSVSLKHGGARISLPRSVVEQLKWTNKMHFKLLVGEGDVAGKLRLDASAEGRITGRIAPSGGGMLIRLGRWPKLAPRDVDTVSVDHEISNGSLVVTLPAHALAVTPAPRVAPSVAPPPVGKVDVTSKFFDDPKDKTGLRSGVRGGR